MQNKEYDQILRAVRSALAGEHADILLAAGDTAEGRDLRLRLIEKHLTDADVMVKGLERPELTRMLYYDTAEFGLITPYYKRDDIEETNCNSYEDVEIVRQAGYEKLDRGYGSPKQLQDYAKKIMEKAGLTLDASHPLGDGYIDTGIRSAAIVSPCVDDDVGAVLSIRRQSKAHITEEEYLKGGTASEAELELLSTFARYGVSMGFSGNTGSGKTTDMNYFLNQIPVSKRIFVIEDTRELDLVKRDEAGKVISRVTHTKTLDSKDPAMRVTMNNLLKMALRFDPDVIVPSEMRDEAAMTAVEAGRTGHGIITSLHAKSAQGAYRRILTLCDMSDTNIRDDLLMEMIVEAFPIIVQKKKLDDGSRRIMEIFEATGCEHGRVQGRTLYCFQITDNVYENGRLVQVVGEHRRVNDISGALAAQLLENGAPRGLVRKFAGSVF